MVNAIPRLGLVHGMGKPPNVSVAAVMRTVARDAQPNWRERDLQAAFKMEVGRLNPEIDWCGAGKVRRQEGERVNSRLKDSLNDRIDLVGYSCTDPPRPLIAFEFKLTSPLGAGKLGKDKRVEFAADIGRLEDLAKRVDGLRSYAILLTTDKQGGSAGVGKGTDDQRVHEKIWQVFQQPRPTIIPQDFEVVNEWTRTADVGDDGRPFRAPLKCHRGTWITFKLRDPDLPQVRYLYVEVS